MKLTLQIKSACNNLLFSPLRTSLAVIGILIGTASVVALLSAGKLATELALEQFNNLGTDLLSVSISPKEQQQPNDFSPITPELINLMTAGIPQIKRLAPYIISFTSAIFLGKSHDITVIATTQNLQNILKISLKYGRFISDLDNSEYYCVIGDNLYQSLYLLNPVGQRIKVSNTIFTIVGVANPLPENSFFTTNINYSVIIPFKTIGSIPNSPKLKDVIIQLNENANNANIDAIKDTLIYFVHHNLPNFKIDVLSAKEIIKSMHDQKEIFILLLGLIGSITLLVGGIGVMNIMLVSVTERKNEIGLRLALGAEPKDIQILFLMEAIILAVMGGISGVLLGIFSAYIVATIAGWKFTLFLFPPIIGFSISVIVSIIFGFYPAYKASQLNPIEALRTK